MSRNPPQLTLDIDVVAGPEYRMLFEQGTVRKRCDEYARDLVDRLALPLLPTINLKPSAAQDHSSLRLVINDYRVALWSPIQPEADAIVSAWCDLFFRGRTLLIGRELCRDLWSHWFRARTKAWEDPVLAAGFMYLCTELVRLGVRPDRARPFLADWKSGTVDAVKIRDALEQAVAQAASSGLHLCLPASHFTQDSRAAQEGSEMSLGKMAEEMSDDLYFELGIPCRLQDPQIDITLSEPWFGLAWNDVKTGPIRGLAPDEFLVDSKVDDLAFLNIKGRKATLPTDGNECAIVNGGKDLQSVCETAGLTTWRRDSHFILHAKSEVRACAAAFVSTAVAELLKVQLAASFPDLVRVVGGRLDHNQLTAVLRGLVDEGFSIRDLRGVFDALVLVNSVTTADFAKLIVIPDHTGVQCPVATGRTFAELAVVDLVDGVRAAMKRAGTYKHTKGNNTLLVYLFGPTVEKRLRSNSPLSSGERSVLLDMIGAEIDALPSRPQPTVLLTAADVRRTLREVVSLEFQRLPVVSYSELEPNINIQPLGRIEVEDWENQPGS